MPRLSKDERNRAVTMLLPFTTQQEVATALGVHQTTVHRLQGRLVQFGNTNDRPRSGRPRVITARSKWISNIWTICSDTKFSESIAHSLITYTVVMCSWHRYGSFYSCSCPIAEMRKSHKAVLYQSISSKCW
jgi:hypothetical protein